MILHTLYSNTHRVLFEEYFKPSIQDTDLKFVFDEVPQEAEGTFLKEGWHETMTRKLKLCQALACGSEIFIHSDCDVQFFAPIRESAEKALEGFDIVFQHDGDQHLCLGLFCARPSRRLAKLFWYAQKLILEDIESQAAVNMLLRPRTPTYDVSDIKYGYLPKTWWTHGCETMKLWEGGEVNPPKDIVAHHANWVYGVDKKIELMKAVRAKVKGA